MLLSGRVQPNLLGLLMSAIKTNYTIRSYENRNVTVWSNEYLVCLPRAIVTLCQVCLVIVKGFTSSFFLKTAYLNLHCLSWKGMDELSNCTVDISLDNIIPLVPS